jgi:hypothetical protein
MHWYYHFPDHSSLVVTSILVGLSPYCDGSVLFNLTFAPFFIGVCRDGVGDVL